MKHAGAFLLGIFLMLATYVFAQGTKPPQSAARKTWEVTSISMDQFVKSKMVHFEDGSGKAVPDFDQWKNEGEAKYEAAKGKLLSEGWEPFTVILSDGIFTNGEVIYFRRQK